MAKGSKKGKSRANQLDPREAKNQRKAERRLAEQRQQRSAPSANRVESEGFNNPYTFAPTPPRNLKHPFAGDYDPSAPDAKEDHSRLWSERYTGVIPVKMTVQTPMFLTKTPEVSDDNGHKTYDCLEHVPATAIKGMLRSAYEVITNSRFGVLNKEQHDHPHGFRAPASAGVVPGRVSKTNAGWEVTLYTGTSKVGRDGHAVGGPLYAAWAPAYKLNQNRQHINPLHGMPNAPSTTPGTAILVKCGHRRWDKRRRQMQDDAWTFWRVVAFDPAGNPVMPKSLPPNPGPSGKWFYELDHAGNPVTTTEKGFLYVSGRMIENKHDERFFFGPMATSIQIENEVVATYNELLGNYREVHEGGAFPPASGCVQGRHITNRNLKLNDGDFVYVTLNDPNGPSRSVDAIYPVQISRDLHPARPWKCIDESLKPADRISKLSPADRLFGWVGAGKTPKGEVSGWRGKIRVSGVDVVNGPERFQEPVPLSILGAPKPTQSRFYCGTKTGAPQSGGIQKRDTAYKEEKEIRGRKLYWTPKKVTNDKAYWTSPNEDRTDQDRNGYRQEYRQPPGESEKSDQNRSITGWYNPGAEVRFELRFENLTQEELGGLMTLLRLDEGAYLRLGLGKPLGLGCVRLTLDDESAPSILPGAKLAEQYRALVPAECATEKLDDAVSAYKDAMNNAYSKDEWHKLPFIEAFLAACRGPANDAPVHYPRTNPARTRNGEVAPSYEWFVENERPISRNVPGIALPGAADSDALPYDPGVMRQRNNGGGRR